MGKFTGPVATPAGPDDQKPRTGKFTGPRKPEETGEDRALAAARKSTKGDALGNEIYQGMTLGFGKDIDSLLTRGVTAAENLGHKAKHEPEPYTSKQAAEAVKRAESEESQKFHEEHPVGATLAGLGGAMAVPGMGELGAAMKALPGPVRAMLMGGAVGGAAGFGESEGDPLERAKGIVPGALTGAATGGVLHGVTHPGGLMKGALHGGMETISRIRDAVGAEGQKPTKEMIEKAQGQSEKMLRDMIQKAHPDLSVLTDNPMEKAGKGVTSAEALGRQFQTMLKAIGRRAGKTPDALDAQLSSRKKEAPSRIIQDFSKVVGVDPEEAFGNLTKTGERLRAKAGQLYKDWHEHEGPIDSELLQKVRGADSFKTAVEHAKTFISDEFGNAYEQGLGTRHELPDMKRNPETGKIEPVINPETGKPHMIPREAAIARARLRGFEHPGIKEDQSKLPTPKAYDYVKRGFDQMLEEFRDKTTKRLDLSSPRAQSLLKLRTKLHEALTDKEQPWGEKAARAFAAGGDPIKLEEAFHSAKDLLSNNMRGTDFAKRLEKMSTAEIEALKNGVVKHVADLVSGAKQSKVNDFLTDTSVLKLQRLFGTDQGNELVHLLQMESDLAKTGARMAPGVGSDTSETLMADKELNESQTALSRAARSAALGHWRTAAAHAVSAPVMGAMRGMQAPMREAQRDVIGSMLRMKPSELAKRLEEISAREAKEAAKPTVGKAVKKVATPVAAQLKKVAPEPVAAIAGGAGGAVGRGQGEGTPTGISVEIEGKTPEMKQVRLPNGRTLLIPMDQ